MSRKAEVLDKIDRLMAAVKAARSRANAVEADAERKVAEKLFDYVLRPLVA